jgi:hypothetical protein
MRLDWLGGVAATAAGAGLDVILKERKQKLK